MKRRQALNPYMPSYEYVPDGEPHIVGDRVYVYGSHDLFGAINFCQGDYVCYSAPVSNLADWRFEGEIYRRDQEPNTPPSRLMNGLAAPDMVQGPDGRFYLYYFMGGTHKISVAVCEEPAGKYVFYGHVKYADGVAIGMKGEPFQFDPGVFLDDDGRLYLYTGFALDSNPILLQGRKPTKHGPMVYELDPTDMLTVKRGPSYLGVGGLEEAKTNKEYGSHLFLEASSMRKFDGRYYFIYSSLNSHELCYAVSDKPTGDFSFGGVLVSNGDIGVNGITDVKHAHQCTGNTHGSLIEIEGKYYVFYHRHSNRKQASRQACAEEIRFENGKFYQAEMTSCGLNGAPLRGSGRYPAYMAFALYGKSGTRFLSMISMRKGDTPYFTQDGGDRESGPAQYIANFCTDSIVGFRYFDLSQTRRIGITLKGDCSHCTIVVQNKERGGEIARIPVKSCSRRKTFFANVKGLSEKEELYFRVEGKGRFQFTSFVLERERK